MEELKDELSLLAKKFATDKYDHRYTPIYNEKFYHIRNDIKKVLEIGAGDGNSLRMWNEYFPNASIYGVDNRECCIQNCSGIPRTEVILGDITKIETIEKIKRIVGNDVDIIIDDASHMSNDMIYAFNNLFSLLKDSDGIGRGLYIIEDVETVDFGGGVEATQFFKNLARCKVLKDNDSWIERNIISIEFHNFLIFIRKGIPDMIFDYLKDKR